MESRNRKFAIWHNLECSYVEKYNLVIFAHNYTLYLLTREGSKSTAQCQKVIPSMENNWFTLQYAINTNGIKKNTGLLNPKILKMCN